MELLLLVFGGVNFVDGQNGDKRCGVQLGDLVQQLFVLVLVEDGDDLVAGAVVVSAVGLIDGAAGIQIVQDELLELVLMLGNDADALALVEAEDEVVEDDTAEIGTNDGQNSGLEIVEEDGRTGDYHTGNDRGLAHINAEEVVEDLGDDIDAARGCVEVEQNGLTDGTEEGEADQIGQRISHDRAIEGRIALEQTHDSRQQDGSIDRFDAELTAQQQKTEDEQTDVKDHGEGSDAERDNVGDQHGQTRNTAQRQSAGDHEEIDSGSDQGGGQRDGDSLVDEITFFHIKKPPGKIFERFIS